MNGAGYVVARKTIEQSPLSDDPPVPAGTRGHVEDDVDGFLWVDFGGPYDVVCCSPEEVR